MEDRAHLLATLAAELQEAPGEDLTAQAVMSSLLDLPGAASASITVHTRGEQLATLASTSDLAQRADELQYAIGEGPCVDAASEDDWCRSSDLAVDHRWSTWGPRAASDLGIHSVLSVRLIGADGRFGAVNIYGTATGLFADPDEIELALLTATHAGVALSSARQITGLQTAMLSRHSIGMAQGILMERFDLDETQSFALLRRYSSVLNTKLHEIAHELVQTRKLPALPQQGDR